jgi:predicted short-subunit dehydrogenase-like oxidoreductase (DUF2520 family)
MAAEQYSRPRAAGHQPTVSIIGAGRLGTALALALSKRGYTIKALATRRPAPRARRAAGLMRLPRPLSVAQLELLPPSDILFVTTPDDEIEATAAQLAALVPAARRRWRVALHASGALCSKALQPLRDRGLAVGSLHPLVSISDPVAGARDLLGAHYCIEGDARAQRAARAIVRRLEGHAFSISARDKPLYHAAAVVACGHTVALIDLALEMLQRCGLSELRARRALIPLVRSTLDNLSAQPPARALTGPFARADVATIRKHIEALRAFPTCDAKTIYILLGRRALQVAQQNNIDAQALREVARVLKNSSQSQRQISRET